MESLFSLCIGRVYDSWTLCVSQEIIRVHLAVTTGKSKSNEEERISCLQISARIRAEWDSFKQNRGSSKFKKRGAKITEPIPGKLLGHGAVSVWCCTHAKQLFQEATS